MVLFFGENTVLLGSDQFHLHFGTCGQFYDLYAGAGRRIFGKLGGIDGIHSGKIVQISQKNRRFHYILEGHTGGSQYSLQVLKYLLCLGFDGVTGQDARFRHQSDLPGGVERASVQYGVGLGSQRGGRLGRSNNC